MRKSILVLLAVAVVASVAGLASGCATLRRNADKLAKNDGRSSRLTRSALEMLDPNSGRYDPERGRAYLEYALKNGTLKAIEMPAPTLLELLRNEKVAVEKSRSLEQQLEILKEIDTTKEEQL